MATPVEAPYQSTSEVTLAVENYYGSDDSGWGGAGSDAFGDIGNSPTLSGSLSAPGEITPAEGFEATCKISNDGGPVNGQIVLAVAPNEGDAYRMDSSQATIDAGGSGTVEFSVPRGSVPSVPGDATLAAISAAGGESAGVITTTGTAITTGEEGDDLGGWSEPEYVRELPFGWHLYAQFKGENEQRFMVSAKDADGTLLHLTKRGRVSSTRTYMDTLDEVSSALAAYQQNVENGTVSEGDQPDPSQSRPSTAEMTDAATTGPSLGGFGGSTVAIVGLLAVGGYVLYRRNGGEIPALDDLSRNQKYAAAGIAAVGLYAWSDSL